jgi:hypothetical protein
MVWRRDIMTVERLAATADLVILGHDSVFPARRGAPR